MRLGDLDQTLYFDAPVGNTWIPQFGGNPIKGRFKGLTGNEQVTQMALGGTITGTIRIRYIPNVKILVSWRIRNKNSIYAIVSPPINVDEKNVWYDMKVKIAS